MSSISIRIIFILQIFLMSLTAFAVSEDSLLEGSAEGSASAEGSSSTSSTLVVSKSLDYKWKMEQNQKFSSMSPELRESLKGKIVIFVAGLWNEGSTPLSRYFGAGLESLQDDLQMTAVRFYPKSYSFNANAEELHKLVVDSFEKYGKPAILIGHSKGGLECLYVILKNSKLVLEGKIERVVLLQAALHGSPLLDARNWVAWISKNFISRLAEGFNVLHPAQATKTIEDAFEHFRNNLAESFELGSEEFRTNWKKVHDCIYHAPSATDYESRSFVTRYCHYWMGDLEIRGTKNDGLLRVEDQQFDRIGNVLDTVESDHSGLVLTHDLDESEECLSSFNFVSGVLEFSRSLCSRVGIPVSTAYLMRIGNSIGSLLGGHSKADQKAYFIALIGHIFEESSEYSMVDLEVTGE